MTRSQDVVAPASSDTDCYQSLPRLTLSQGLAVAALATGSTHMQAAAIAGVHRITVTRWLSHDPAVIAAINVLRDEAADRLRAQVDRISELALTSIENAVESRDLSAAFRWLRLLSLQRLTAGPVGSCDPTEVALTNQVASQSIGAGATQNYRRLGGGVSSESSVPNVISPSTGRLSAASRSTE